MTEMHDVLIKEFSEILERALEVTVNNIINELPKGHSSSIANDLFVEKISDTEFDIVITNPVWDYLDKGTGIYSEVHRGKGPGGMIIPVNSEALHFKNIEIALALGFPDENVFLKSVKGIRPRYFFDRYFLTSRFAETFQNVQE